MSLLKNLLDQSRPTPGSAPGQSPLIKIAPRAAGCFLGCFGIIWSLVTLGFDGFVIWTMAGQWSTLSYPSVEGRIIESRIESHTTRSTSRTTGRSYSTGRSRTGTSHKAVLRYQYNVGGQDYESDRFAFVEMSFSEKQSAQAVVKAHPVDSPVEVFYNPDDPSMAVLRRGLDASDWFFPIFLIPFNVIMIAILWAAFALSRADESLRNFDLVIAVRGHQTRIRRPMLPAWLIGLAFSGAAAFIMVFVLAFGFGLNPPMPVIVFTFSLLAAAAALGAIKASRSKTRRSRIIIDEVGRRIAFLHGWGRASNARVEKMLHNLARRQTTDRPADLNPDPIAQDHAHALDDPLAAPADTLDLPFARIRSISTQRLPAPRKPAAAILIITYEDNSHTPRQHKLWGWSRMDQAQAFAQWLSQKLGLPSEVAATRDAK